MTIAVDFDGTLVEHRYPEIGKEFPFAFAALRKLMKDGHTLVLWTVREGRLLDEAVEFCKSKGVEFAAVNGFYPDDSLAVDLSSRKLKVSLFIDDRNLGGLPCLDRKPGVPDWAAIYDMISTGMSADEFYRRKYSDRQHKKSWISRLLGR